MPLKTAKLYQPHIRLLNHEQCDFTAIDQNLVTSYQNNTITVTLYWYEMLYRKYIKYIPKSFFSTILDLKRLNVL